jgi:hypothetical protein
LVRLWMEWCWPMPSRSKRFFLSKHENCNITPNSVVLQRRFSSGSFRLHNI